MRPAILALCLLSYSLPALASPPPSPRRAAELKAQADRNQARKATSARTARYKAQQAQAAELYYRQHILPVEQDAAFRAWQLQLEAQKAQGIGNMGTAALQNAEINRRRLILQRQVSGYSSPPLVQPFGP